MENYNSEDITDKELSVDTLLDDPLPEVLVTHLVHRIGPDLDNRIYYIQEWLTIENKVIYSCSCPHFHYRLGPYVTYPYQGCKHMHKIYF